MTLVERLRMKPSITICDEAADRIEELEAQLQAIKDQEPTAWWNGKHSSPCLSLIEGTPGIGNGGTPLYTNEVLKK